MYSDYNSGHSNAPVAYREYGGSTPVKSSSNGGFFSSVVDHIMDRYGDNLMLDLNPEYSYEEVHDFEGRCASHRSFKIGGNVNYVGKNRQR